VLYTDAPASAEIDELPAAFDAAVPHWRRYFALDAAKTADWQVTGALMVSAERFASAGLLPGDLPAFKNGYSRGRKLWLYEQTSPYYRRHLLLHEGVHCVMNSLLGGSGPPWYAEGMAELLATHQWENGKMTVGFLPPRREAVPGWGRVELVQLAVAAGRSKSLAEVLAYDARAHRETEPYGWSWAAATMLQRHPRYRGRFGQLRAHVRDVDFQGRFDALFAKDRRELAEEWQVMVANLEYGYDFERMAIEFADGKPLTAGKATAQVKADRGWQASGVRLEAGKSYRLRAAGRYQVAAGPKPWMSEPGGVTLRYYRGRPLGTMLFAVRPTDRKQTASALVRPLVLGLETTFKCEQTGTLYLRINDSAAELADNSGQAEVMVEER
jgi:hypothetical protein